MTPFLSLQTPTHWRKNAQTNTGMADLFDVQCSIYADAKDNSGRFIDRATGAPLQAMTIRDFCLTERWRPVVEQLRALVAEYGAEQAKARDDYSRLKHFLPGATLSGLFGLSEEYNDKLQRNVLVSRRTSHLLQHTGFLCIDIDRQDNTSLSSMDLILRVLRHRPEVALIMRSCSGTGYFALIPLAYPKYHKEQFKALMREYTALGVKIDRQCSDITRIRFASYDSNPYINPNAIPYSGMDMGDQMLAPRAAVYTPRVETPDDLVTRVEKLVCKLEQHHIDITSSYGDWMRVGFSLANLQEPYGRQFFHRVSAICEKYNATICDKKFDDLQSPSRIGIGTFFAICKDYGVTLRS